MKHPSRSWWYSCLVLGALSLVVRACAQAWSIDIFSFHADHWLTQPWTWFTAPLLTPSFPHWLAHLGGLLLLGILGDTMRASRADACCLWLCWPLSCLGLLLWPDLPAEAAGLSAMTHAAGAILLVRMSLFGEHPWLSSLAISLLAFKLGLEHAWLTPQSFSADWQTPIWPALNLSGTLAGVFTAQIALRWKAHP